MEAHSLLLASALLHDLVQGGCLGAVPALQHRHSLCGAAQRHLAVTFLSELASTCPSPCVHQISKPDLDGWQRPCRDSIASSELRHTEC